MMVLIFWRHSYFHPTHHQARLAASPNKNASRTYITSPDGVDNEEFGYESRLSFKCGRALENVILLGLKHKRGQWLLHASVTTLTKTVMSGRHP